MSKLPAFVFKGVSIATTYRLQVPESLGGWALCTVNDETGELSIQSDWGNWSYRWSPNPTHLGAPTLTHFLGDRSSADYVANKLWGGGSYGQVFSADLTIAAFRKELCKERLEQGREQRRYGLDSALIRTQPYYTSYDKEPLTAGIAREIWDELGGDIADAKSEELFLERFFNISGHGWMFEEPWNHFETQEAWPFTVLKDAILPVLIEECRKRAAAMPVASEAQQA